MKLLLKFWPDDDDWIGRGGGKIDKAKERTNGKINIDKGGIK